MKTVIGSVVAKNYLPFARVLAESIRRWHPELPFVLVLVDETDGLFDAAAEPFAVWGLERLAIPNRADFTFRYLRRESVSAAKPFLLAALLEAGYERVLFLDADMILLERLDSLLERVGRHAMTVTPHTLRPGLGVDAELNFLQCGVFNGGVVGLTDRAETRAFLEWWKTRTREHCRYAIEDGMHLDQRWLDYAPSFVSDLGVERDAAYNVAYWNLAERPDRAEWRLFHFSGYEPDKPEQVTRYWPERTMADVGAPAAALLQEYGRRLMAAGYGETKEWAYTYDRFANGDPVTLAAREAYGRLGPAAAYFTDPFGAEMREWLEETTFPDVSAELGMWRTAAGERLIKLEEANRMLGEQQGELDRLRNELAGERERAAWWEGQAAMFERAAGERLALLEQGELTGLTGAGRLGGEPEEGTQ